MRFAFTGNTEGSRGGRASLQVGAASLVSVAVGIALSTQVAAAASRSTLHRVPDPVVIVAEKLGAMNGRKLDRLGAFALTDDGALAPIPFQIDEKTADGANFVYSGGRERNPEAGNGVLDGHDELVLMASDCGGRVVGAADAREGNEDSRGAAGAEAAPSPWPTGTERVAEIEVSDPADGTRGFAYLLAFADAAPLPARSLERYVHYDAETETIAASSYTMQYEPGKDRIFFSSISIPASAGGNGQDFVDRLKMRTSIETKLFFSVSFDEDEWASVVAAYLDGPVRAIRQVKNRLSFLGIPVAPTIVVEATYYRDFHVAPTRIHQTVDFPSIASAAWFKAAVDLNDAARGMRYYRPSGDGASPWHGIDGVPTEDERNLDPHQPPWHLVTGAPGTFLWLMELPKPLVPATRLELHDDAASPEPPESTPGTLGELTYRIDLMPLAPGDYQMRVFYLFPPRWQPGDEARWLAMTRQPLAATIVAREVDAATPAPAKTSAP